MIPESAFTGDKNLVEKKEEIISVGSLNNVSKKNFPKNRLLLILITILSVSLPATIFLVGKRQEIRERAVGGGNLVCRRWDMPSGGYLNPPISGWVGDNINFYRNPELDQTGEEVMYRCDYRKIYEAVGGDLTKFRCTDEDIDAGRGIHPENKSLDKSYRTLGCSGTDPQNACYTQRIEDFVDKKFFGGKCQVIQIDLTHCNTQAVGDYPAWDGGVAFVIAYNPDCPEVTPTPTLTPTPISTSTPTPTSTPTGTPRPTPTSTPTPTPTGTPTPTPTGTPRPTPTPTPIPQPTATSTPTLTGTPRPTPTPTPTSPPQAQATPTPTTYVAQVELPQAGITLPTAGAVFGGVVLLLTSLLLIF